MGRPADLMLTPQKAQQMLSTHNDSGPPPRANPGKDEQLISLYAQQMLSGQWGNYTDEYVVVSVAGSKLLFNGVAYQQGAIVDGYLRVSAVVRANVSALFFVDFDAQTADMVEDERKVYGQMQGWIKNATLTFTYS